MCFSMEIIETYWNVNAIDFVISKVVALEIIETYWNVNQIIESIVNFFAGNNRNILECKLEWCL